jgi:hypothetical protein
VLALKSPEAKTSANVPTVAEVETVAPAGPTVTCTGFVSPLQAEGAEDETGVGVAVGLGVGVAVGLGVGLALGFGVGEPAMVGVGVGVGFEPRVTTGETGVP